jgi:hypothetical protein
LLAGLRQKLQIDHAKPATPISASACLQKRLGERDLGKQRLRGMVVDLSVAQHGLQ